MLNRFYDDLLAAFGPQHWWPVSWAPETAPWEIAVGAVLTQNTNWNNVERALRRLYEAGCTTAGDLLRLTDTELAERIRPAGYFNVKAKRLKALAQWWQDNVAAAAEPTTSLADLRRDLLAVHGVGPETADSILLYAFNRPSFVIDAYTKRVLSRHGLADGRTSYAALQERFESALPRDAAVYNEYHALLVRLAKAHCRPTPQCEGCPLAWDLKARRD